MSEDRPRTPPRARVELVGALASGLLFGAGLVVSGMADPAKVLAFLDVGGAWDPSLAFVMAGAIGVAFFGFRTAGRRLTSISGAPMDLPRRRDIGPSLVIGSALFGVGWGLAGLCPGPAFVAAGAGHLDAFFFLAAMLGGAALVDLARWERAPLRDPDDAPH